MMKSSYVENAAILALLVAAAGIHPAVAAPNHNAGLIALGENSDQKIVAETAAFERENIVGFDLGRERKDFEPISEQRGRAVQGPSHDTNTDDPQRGGAGVSNDPTSTAPNSIRFDHDGSGHATKRLSKTEVVAETSEQQRKQADQRTDGRKEWAEEDEVFARQSSIGRTTGGRFDETLFTNSLLLLGGSIAGILFAVLSLRRPGSWKLHRDALCLLACSSSAFPIAVAGTYLGYHYGAKYEKGGRTGPEENAPIAIPHGRSPKEGLVPLR